MPRDTKRQNNPHLPKKLMFGVEQTRNQWSPKTDDTFDVCSVTVSAH
jgi:hypothetical protein